MRVGHTIQERIYRYEQDATLIRAWQPEIVLGILQHPDYTRALVGDVDHAWWEPRRRRLALLHTPGKMWHQLMSEAALRWVLGSYDVMATQLSHLDQMIAAVPTLRLGIVPLGVPQPIAPPAAFHVYDKQVAIDATQTATAFLTQPKDIAHYVREFDKLAGIALYGDGARDLLGRVAAEYGDKRS